MKRDWSSLVRLGGSLAYLAVALALVTGPFWLVPHAGETAYEYAASEITYEDDPQTYLRAPSDLDSLDCYGPHEFGRGCLAAAYVAQNGPITVDSTSFGRYYDTGTEYVVVEDDMTEAPFYRRVVNRTDTRVTYSLEQVTPGDILRNVSLDESEVSEETRRAVGGETVRVYGEPLSEAGAVVRSNGTYYLVEEHRHRPQYGEVEARFWRGVSFAVGLAMLRRRWRRAEPPRSNGESYPDSPN